MKVYLDDERQTPEGLTRAYTVQEVIRLLETRQVEVISLDNDLGEGQEEGYRVLDILEEWVYDDPSFPLPEITIHSANPTSVEHMKRAIQSIQRIRKQQEEHQ